ncbi:MULTISPECIES: HNH endonuclease [Providencia]|uniref:HNH endonuclease n=2 Tax=Morganellaceae TaxID=1903414 RepID=UPI0012B616EA|nr:MULTISPECIES: HNH endonuclease [Providencia]ELR5220819.1 HNH endonuclease [Providencia rettgeri]MDX7321139.1 HNH endonuclease [Providencia rettgeri]MTB39318.1 HNH endonuclease [Providencia sp. wls1949]QLQ95587.1 HNH endonuclease [Providencia rettgeri]WEB86198.1 HNH endonuclease [Providencia rettgeri]
MSNISFDNEEMEIIESAIERGHDSWKDASLETIKRKIKNYLRQHQSECCCYCSRNTDDEFNMVLDIEHIIPKSKIVSEMFEIRNLAISCKRCNMRIKGDDISFINEDFAYFKTNKNYYQSDKYKFIHPNLDGWDEHLIYCVVQNNRKKIVYYKVVDGSQKGEYTKNYFQLNKIQANTFDEAQGTTSRKEPRDLLIAEDFSKLVESLLGKE